MADADEGSQKRRIEDNNDDDVPDAKRPRTDQSAAAAPKGRRVRFNEKVEQKFIKSRSARRGKTTDEELYHGQTKNINVDEEGREIGGDKSSHHTLESDEEEEADHDVLDVRQLGGQEERTVDFEGDTKITPFNMDEDMEEGHFDKSGNFIYDKKTEDLKDPWFDSVNWNKVQTVEEKDDGDEEAEEEELEQDTLTNRLPSYQIMVQYLQDGETANDAMKRLNKSRLTLPEERKLRFAAKKAGQPYVDPIADQIEKITAAADVLVKKGDNTIYEMTKEDIQKTIDGAQSSKNEDIFRDDDDDEEDATEETEIMWEYKLANEDDSALKKASTKEMMDLNESGQLPSDALVRRCGTDNFYTAGRVDFEIYLD